MALAFFNQGISLNEKNMKAVISDLNESFNWIQSVKSSIVSDAQDAIIQSLKKKAQKMSFRDAVVFIKCIDENYSMENPFKRNRGHLREVTLDVEARIKLLQLSLYQAYLEYAKYKIAKKVGEDTKAYEVNFTDYIKSFIHSSLEELEYEDYTEYINGLMSINIFGISALMGGESDGTK